MGTRGRPPGGRNAKGAWREMMDESERSGVEQAEAAIDEAKKRYREASGTPRNHIKTIRGRCIARQRAQDARRREEG